jgi:hypothetical protein
MKRITAVALLVLLTTPTKLSRSPRAVDEGVGVHDHSRAE